MPYWVVQILNWMSLPVLAVVAGILVWRRAYREFPIFLGFLLVSEVVGLFRLMALFRMRHAYTQIYWVSDLAFMTFNFLAVYELLARLFPRFYRVRFYRILFTGAAGATILAGWLTAIESSHKTAALLIEARVLDFVVVAMLAFLVALMLFMGRQWTRQEFGIAFGFAINAAADLITSAAWVRTHYQRTSIDQLPLIAFDISCLVWFITFFQPQQRTHFVSAEELDPAMLHEARTWEAQLKDWIIPGKSKRS